MREYGYNSMLKVTLDMAGQIRFIQEAYQEVMGKHGAVSGSDYSPEHILPGLGRQSI